MKISKLELKNFRCHEDAALELDRLNFILGPNGAGKSSIQMAIEELLTGKCQVTDGAGRGAEDLIQTGAKEFDLHAVLETAQSKTLTVNRRRSARNHVLNVAGRNGQLAAIQQGIYRDLGAGEDVLAALLNASRFVEMDTKEQKRLLAQVLNTGEIPVPGKIRALIPNVLISTIADLDNAYKLFFAERTDVNRQLKQLGEAESEPMVPEDCPATEAVEGKLRDLHTEKETQIRKQAEVAADNERLETERGHLEQDKQAAKDDLLPQEEFKHMGAEVEKADSYRALQQTIINCQGKINVLIESLQKLKKLRGADCPTCLQPLDKKGLKKTIFTLQGDLTKEEKNLEVWQEERAQRYDPAAALRALEKHQRADFRMEELDRDLKKLRAPRKAAVDLFDGEIQKLAERIDKGEAILRQVCELRQAKSLWQQANQQRSELAQRKQELETLVEFFGPTGVKAKLVGDRSTDFCAALNRHLIRFGFAVSVKAGQLWVCTDVPAGSALAIHQLSDSEKFRFGVAFQIALAEITGLKFAVIDHADILDDDCRQQLTAMLMEAQLDQAIVLSTAKELPPAAESPPEGVKFFWLGPGEHERSE